MHLQLRQRVVDVSITPLVMGVLNVTPDSFSDGGEHLDSDDAVARAREMITEGADIIDVGPESTRPAYVYGQGSAEVSVAGQVARAIPVIQAIREADSEIALSIDTRLAPVARAALDAGVDMVNDVSALRDDPAMVEVVAASNALVCLMHRKGQPRDMQREGGPQYDDVIHEIRGFFWQRVEHAVNGGVDESQIILDPGIGFGKRAEHNLLIFKHLDRLVDLGRPVLIGASRKSFIGQALGIDDPKQRDAGSLACAVLACLSGAAIIRTHDVRSTVEAMGLVQAIRRA